MRPSGAAALCADAWVTPQPWLLPALPVAQSLCPAVAIAPALQSSLLQGPGVRRVRGVEASTRAPHCERFSTGRGRRTTEPSCAHVGERWCRAEPSPWAGQGVSVQGRPPGPCKDLCARVAATNGPGFSVSVWRWLI